MSIPDQIQPGASLPQKFEPAPLPEIRRPRPHFYDEFDERVTLRQYLEILAKRKWQVIAVMLTFVGLAGLQVFTASPLYRATATIQIDPEESNVLPYEGVSNLPQSRTASEEYLATQSRNLHTRTLARRVIERLGLAEEPAFTTPPSRGFLIDQAAASKALIAGLAGRGEPAEGDAAAALVDRFLEALEVAQIRDTRLVEIQFLSPEPDLSARIVNTLVEEFTEQQFEGNYDSGTKAGEFLQKQLDELQAKIEQSEEALIRYARENEIVNLNERETINLQRLTDLSAEVTRVETELTAKAAEFRSVQSATPENFPESLENATTQSLDAHLSGLQRTLAALLGTHGSQWPAVKQTRLEIAEVEAQLFNERQRLIDAARSSYSTSLNRRDLLSASLDQQRQSVDRFNDALIQYNILKREVDTNQELYQGLLQRLKETGVAAGLKSSNVRFVDAALTPRGPALPDKPLTLTLALLLGAICGMALAFITDAMDHSLRTTEDVAEYLGLPALGLVPLLSVAKRRRRLALFRGDSMDRGLGPMIAFGDAQTPEPWTEEPFRAIRTSILLSHSGKPPQSILVTSAQAREGKTTTALDTAIVLAQTGARTLLVDLDMRRPSLTETFSFEGRPGMSTYLSGNTDLSSQIQETSFPNLFIVPAGPLPPNPAELIGSERMGTGMQLLSEYFTYIVIDTPPSLEISDALVLSPLVDGVMLVVRGGKTPREAIRKAAGRFLAIGSGILGVVVNGVEVKVTEYGYMDSYSYRYPSNRGTGAVPGAAEAKAPKPKPEASRAG